MQPFGVTVNGSKQRVFDRLEETADKNEAARNIIHAVRDHVAALPDNAQISLSLSVMLNYTAEPLAGPREVGI